VKAMRNFANKIWNIGRFLKIQTENKDRDAQASKITQKLESEFSSVSKKYHQQMQALQLSQAFNDLYEFVWHRFADYYLENLKPELKDGNIKTLTIVKKIWLSCLAWLHPFMPFVTEAVYQEFTNKQSSLLIFKNYEQKLSGTQNLKD
jgi:valyl-tRNA synthetase